MVAVLGQTEFQHPKTRSAQMPRPRMMNLLSEIPDFPLTVIRAGAGYGKTTAVATYLDQCRLRSAWLTLTTEDRDAARFVERLLYALLPKEASTPELNTLLLATHSPVTWIASAISAAELIAGSGVRETILVLDDFHVLDEELLHVSWIDAWLERLPHSIHVVLVTRTKPMFPSVEKMVLRGAAHVIRERDLSFNEDEISALFRLSSSEGNPLLNTRQVRFLLDRTDGMALVLSLLLREWRNTQSFQPLQMLLADHTSIHEQVGRLFAIGLSVVELEFFRNTSILVKLTPTACDALLGRSDSLDVLRDCERRGHITQTLEHDSFQLHPLVRDYLLSLLPAEQRRSLLESVIGWYEQQGDTSQVVGYLFELPNTEERIARLFPYILRFLETGQLSTVQSWLDRLPPTVVSNSPQLLFVEAEVDRLSNRFTEAKSRYEQGFHCAVLEEDRRVAAQMQIGLTRLFLDTIEPKPAAVTLRLARSWMPRTDLEGRLTLLQLAYENAINLGRSKRALRLQRILAGKSLPPNNSDVRLLLRTGHVAEAAAAVRRRLDPDDCHMRTALAHRETSLLYSLFCSMLGNPELAKEEAERGRWIADSLNAPFVRAVGFIRLGHALLLMHPLSDNALTAYETAINLMDEMEVARGKAEALLGLCLAHGYRGKFPLARLYAEQGMLIASRAGDVWMENLVRTAFGQVCVLHGQHVLGLTELGESIRVFEQCNDSFMCNAARLWKVISMFEQGDPSYQAELAFLLRNVALHGHLDLLMKSTLFGVKDKQRMVPLFMAHRLAGLETRHAVQILEHLDASQLDYHPGYTLYVQTFGAFTVHRGFQSVTRREWQREKARQLFQFLLTYRGQWLHREEICERLWGEQPQETAERDFKVALNVLSAALEPNRPGRGSTAFILRQGSLYTVTSHAMLQVDKDVFLQRIREAEQTKDKQQKRVLLSHAMKLYNGAYLEEARYEPWCEDERERLRVFYLKAATTYADLCHNDNLFDDVVRACELILIVEPTWEDAYALLMKAYAQVGNRSMLMHTYRLCERALERELGIPVTPSTAQLYETLRAQM